MKIKSRVQERLSNMIHTLHAVEREYQEGITAMDVEGSLKKGFEIVENYPDDPRGESCLILCWLDHTPLHVVCAPYEDALVIISVYFPEIDKWMDNYRDRRR